ncbi:hypothetical protein NEIRO03_0698 [Nematocida sp. AWRm78]|nr:hypothetical protein NEIRO02_0904 [Nematocida sp. AWRm79]KAI5183074.1 hypothetical protein NEIRO03_0698 [Nematocida sp. AWRm78]
MLLDKNRSILIKNYRKLVTNGLSIIAFLFMLETYLIRQVFTKYTTNEIESIQKHEFVCSNGEIMHVNPNGPLGLEAAYILHTIGIVERFRLFSPILKVASTTDHNITSKSEEDKEEEEDFIPASLHPTGEPLESIKEHYSVFIHLFPFIKRMKSIETLCPDSFYVFLNSCGENQNNYKILAALLLLTENLDVPLGLEEDETGTFLVLKSISAENDVFRVKICTPPKIADELPNSAENCKLAKSNVLDVLNFFIHNKNNIGLLEQIYPANGKQHEYCILERFSSTPGFLIQMYIYCYIEEENNMTAFIQIVHDLLYEYSQTVQKSICQKETENSVLACVIPVVEENYTSHPDKESSTETRANADTSSTTPMHQMALAVYGAYFIDSSKYTVFKIDEPIKKYNEIMNIKILSHVNVLINKFATKKELIEEEKNLLIKIKEFAWIVKSQDLRSHLYKVYLKCMLNSNSFSSSSEIEYMKSITKMPKERFTDMNKFIVSKQIVFHIYRLTLIRYLTLYSIHLNLPKSHPVMCFNDNLIQNLLIHDIYIIRQLVCFFSYIKSLWDISEYEYISNCEENCSMDLFYYKEELYKIILCIVEIDSPEILCKFIKIHIKEMEKLHNITSVLFSMPCGEQKSVIACLTKNGTTMEYIISILNYLKENKEKIKEMPENSKNLTSDQQEKSAAMLFIMIDLSRSNPQRFRGIINQCYDLIVLDSKSLNSITMWKELPLYVLRQRVCFFQNMVNNILKKQQKVDIKLKILLEIHKKAITEKIELGKKEHMENSLREKSKDLISSFSKKTASLNEFNRCADKIQERLANILRETFLSKIKFLLYRTFNCLYGLDISAQQIPDEVGKLKRIYKYIYFSTLDNSSSSSIESNIENACNELIPLKRFLKLDISDVSNILGDLKRFKNKKASMETNKLSKTMQAIRKIDDITKMHLIEEELGEIFQLTEASRKKINENINNLIFLELDSSKRNESSITSSVSLISSVIVSVFSIIENIIGESID